MSEVTQYAPFKARLVMGSPFDLKTTDHTGKPEADTSKHHWFMGFAIPKGPEWDAIWSAMWNAAANDASCTQALCGQQGFNWKFEDCDAPENPQNLGKASYPAGHMLIKFTRYNAMGPCPVIDGSYMPLDKSQVKRGDWFWVSASCKFNGAATVKTNAGMYQNINGVMFAEAGEEIASEGGFNAATVFAGFQGGMAPRANAPAGGSMAPVTPPPAAPAPVTPPPAAPAPVTPPPAAPAPVTPPPAAPAPATDILEPTYVLPDGSGYKRQQLLDAGWEDPQIDALPTL